MRGRNINGLPNPGWFKAGQSKVKSASHRKAISESQKRAWQHSRKRQQGPRARKPIGSRWIDAGGYVRVKVVAGDGPWRLEHVLVMETRLGRALIRGEIVHHIDGDRQNNADSNLFLCRNHNHHMTVERQLKETFRAILGAGRVTFSQALGVYAWHP